MKYKKESIIEISWMDSCHSSGWTYEDDYNTEDAWIYHKTVGYFFKETEKTICVTQSKREKSDKIGKKSYDALMQIPKMAIIKIRKIK